MSANLCHLVSITDVTNQNIQQATVTKSFNLRFKPDNLLSSRTKLYEIHFTGNKIEHQTISLQNSNILFTVISITGIQLSIDNCTFMNSAIHVNCLHHVTQRCSLSITNSTFATEKSSQVSWCFGLICCYGCNIFLSRLIVSHNFQNASSPHGLIKLQQSSVTLEESQFISNKGGIVNAINGVLMTLLNCTFENNSASNEESVIFGRHSVSVSIHSCLFLNNKAEIGGAIAMKGNSSLTVIKSSFTGNHAKTSGGVIYATSNSKLTITSSTFNNNKAELKGGVIYTENQISILICSSDFQGNMALRTVWTDGGGVVFAVSGILLSFQNCSFVDNSASGDGGVINGQNQATVTIVSSKFHNNSAARHAGVLSGWQNVNVSVESSSFTENRAESEGGVIRAQDHTAFTIISSTFHNNSASRLGGVLLGWRNMNVSVESSSFTENRANLNGGVIWWGDHTAITIVSSTFHNNSADKNGGVIWAAENISLSLSFCSFMCNSAGSPPGCSPHHTGLTFPFAVLSESTTSTGGVIWARKEIVLMIRSCSFHENSAEKGGVLLLVESSLNVVLCHFERNTAQQIGIIHTGKSRVSIRESKFVDNNGSVIVLEKATSQESYWSRFTECLFFNNFHPNSLTAEDLSLMNPTILHNVSISKTWSFSGTTSLFSSSQVHASFLSFKLQAGSMTDIARISQLYWNKTSGDSIILLLCPHFVKPESLSSSLMDDGISGVRLQCTPCVQSYYLGNNIVVTTVIPATSPPQQNTSSVCRMQKLIKFMTSWQTETINLYSLCVSKEEEAQCIACPHGANCSSGVTALPNFWGTKQANKLLTFARCPHGYCCDKDPCAEFNSCVENRTGVLCGKCLPGYTEALFSPKCILKTECQHRWIIPIYFVWLFSVSLIILFFNDVKNHVKVKLKCTTSDSEDATQKEFYSLQSNPNQPKSVGFFTVTKLFTDTETGGGNILKYAQIVVFYLQDASLLQIDLPISDTESSLASYPFLFQISSLAIETFNWGKSVCLSFTMTPITKIVLKATMGPLLVANYVIMFAIFQIVGHFCSNVSKHKEHVLTNLSSATITVLLLFYQKLASSALSLIHCVQVGDNYVLLMEGTVECFQLWHIPVFLFILSWVIPFVIVLAAGPILLSKRKIDVSEFFLSCFLPLPLLLLRAWKRWKGKWKTKYRNISVWHVEIIDSMQKTFKEISIKHIDMISWNGVIKWRRLFLVFCFTFITNCTIRLITMISFTFLFLVLHLVISPYQDRRANQLFTLSLLLSIFVGLINLVKAGYVEGLTLLVNIKITIKVCETVLDVILLWAPLSVAGIVAFAMLGNKLWAKVRSKQHQGEEIEMDEKTREMSESCPVLLAKTAEG